MSGSYLYCPTPGCGEYLGSLGGDSCQYCGWRAGEPRRFGDDQGEPSPGDELADGVDLPDGGRNG